MLDAPGSKVYPLDSSLLSIPLGRPAVIGVDRGKGRLLTVPPACEVTCKFAMLLVRCCTSDSSSFAQCSDILPHGLPLSVFFVICALQTFIVLVPVESATCVGLCSSVEQSDEGEAGRVRPP